VQLSVLYFFRLNCMGVKRESESSCSMAWDGMMCCMCIEHACMHKASCTSSESEAHNYIAIANIVWAKTTFTTHRHDDDTVTQTGQQNALRQLDRHRLTQSHKDTNSIEHGPELAHQVIVINHFYFCVLFLSLYFN
jgi:hypothetical protein